MNERFRSLPKICAESDSEDSPMSLFFAKSTRCFLFGSKLSETFWNESAKIVVRFSAVSKSFRSTTASTMESFGIIWR